MRKLTLPAKIADVKLIHLPPQTVSFPNELVEDSATHSYPHADALAAYLVQAPQTVNCEPTHPCMLSHNLGADLEATHWFSWGSIMQHYVALLNASECCNLMQSLKCLGHARSWDLLGHAMTCPLKCLGQARSWDMPFEMLGTGSLRLARL